MPQKTPAPAWRRRFTEQQVPVVLICFCLLWEQCRTISFPSSSEILSLIRIAEVVLLGAVLFRIPYRKHRWYLIMILSLLVIIITSWLRSPDILKKTRSTISEPILVLLLCPAVGILCQGKSLRTLIRSFAGAWTLINTGLCIVGLYAATHGIRIMNYSQTKYIGLNNHPNLLLWASNTNNTAVLLSLSIVTAYIGAAAARKKWISALYLLGVIPMFLCLAMTNGRAAMISAWAATGIAFAAICQKPFVRYVRRKWLRWPLSALLVFLVLFLGLIGTQAAVRGFNELQLRSGILISAARAEAGTLPESVSQIPVQVAGSNYFSGHLNDREPLWSAALKALRRKPSLLLTGTSIHTVMKDMMEIVPELSTKLPHLHNEFLQILISTGIWGAMLFIAFLIQAFRAAFRLYAQTERPLWEQLLFLPFLVIFLIDLVESVRISSFPDLLGLMMFFTGAAIEVSAKGRPAGNGNVLPA